jgi:hypothetical protein
MKKRDGEPERDGLVKWRRHPEQAEEALERERVAAVGMSRYIGGGQSMVAIPSTRWLRGGARFLPYEEDNDRRRHRK